MKKAMQHKYNQQRTILGVTLTKRGWTNVLIYVVLIMMFVFYFVGQDNNSDESFHPFAVYSIVELRDRQHELVRVGNQWELRQGQLNSVEQSRWLDAWQGLLLSPHDGLLEGEEYVVELSVADQNGTLRVAVFFQDDQVLVALPGYDQVFVASHEYAAYLRPAR